MQILSKKCHNLFFYVFKRQIGIKTKPNSDYIHFGKIDFNQFHYKKKIIQAVY